VVRRESAEAHYNLGIALERGGTDPRGMADIAGHRSRSGISDTHYNLGLALERGAVR
jgi:hypothetical protein